MSDINRNLFYIVRDNTKVQKLKRDTCVLRFSYGDIYWSKVTIRVWVQGPDDEKRDDNLTSGFQLRETGEVFETMPKAACAGYEKLTHNIQEKWKPEIVQEILDTDHLCQQMTEFVKEKDNPIMPVFPFPMRF